MLTFELFGDEIPREGDESFEISWFNGDRRLTPARPHTDSPAASCKGQKYCRHGSVKPADVD